MSSEMFMFDEAYYQDLDHQNMHSPEISTNFFTDPISAFSDSSIDSILQDISSNNSPPSHQLETLNLSQQQQEQAHLVNLSTGFSCYDVSEVKTEDFHMGFDSPRYNNNTSYLLGGNSNSYCDDDSFAKFLQRSYSSNSVEGKPGFLFQPGFDTLFETPNFTNMDSPEMDSDLSNTQMRRVCSTGDLREVRSNPTIHLGVCASTTGSIGVGGDGNFMEEANLKVGRYSAEERKERIDRYRAKRTQRNFNKTIKYACRKTLADNRPRIRGRFARNDETGEIPKPTSFHRYEDEDDLWVVNLQEEEEGILRSEGGRFLSNFGGTHFQYCGY